MQKFLNKLLPYQVVRRMKMLRDNQISLTLTKNLKNQNYTKYIDVIHYYIQGFIDDKELKLE